MTHSPDVITYSNVVTRETEHLVFIMAVLHDLEVKAAVVLNAFMTTPNRQKIWKVLCPEFGHDAGKSTIIVRA